MMIIDKEKTDCRTITIGMTFGFFHKAQYVYTEIKQRDLLSLINRSNNKILKEQLIRLIEKIDEVDKVTTLFDEPISKKKLMTIQQREITIKSVE